MVWRRGFGSLHYDSSRGRRGIIESLSGWDRYHDAVRQPVPARDGNYKCVRFVPDRTYNDSIDGAAKATSKLALLIGDRIFGRVHHILQLSVGNVKFG